MKSILNYFFLVTVNIHIVDKVYFLNFEFFFCFSCSGPVDLNFIIIGPLVTLSFPPLKRTKSNRLVKCRDQTTTTAKSDNISMKQRVRFSAIRQ